MGWIGRWLYAMATMFVRARRMYNGVELDHATKPFTWWEKKKVRLLL